MQTLQNCTHYIHIDKHYKLDKNEFIADGMGFKNTFKARVTTQWVKAPAIMHDA